MKQIYIKPTKRKFRDLECFDVTDAEGNKLIGDECKVIRFRVDGEEVFHIVKPYKKGICISGNIEIEPFVNTLEINVKSDTKAVGTVPEAIEERWEKGIYILDHTTPIKEDDAIDVLQYTLENCENLKKVCDEFEKAMFIYRLFKRKWE